MDHTNKSSSSPRYVWLYAGLSVLPVGLLAILLFYPISLPILKPVVPWLEVFSIYFSMLMVVLFGHRFYQQGSWAFYWFALGFLFHIFLVLVKFAVLFFKVSVPGTVTMVVSVFPEPVLAVFILLASFSCHKLIDLNKVKTTGFIYFLTSLIIQLVAILLLSQLLKAEHVASYFRPVISMAGILSLVLAIVLFYREYRLEKLHFYFWLGIITTLTLSSFLCLAVSVTGNDQFYLLGTCFFIVAQSGYLIVLASDKTLVTETEYHIHKRLEKSLIKAENATSRYQGILQNLGIGVGTLSEVEKFTFCNDALLKIFNRSYNSIIDNSLSNFIFKAELEKFEQQKLNWQKGKGGDFDIAIVLPSGRQRSIRIYANPVWHWGNLLDVQIAVIDLTEQQEVQHDLQQTLAELRKTIELKNQELLSGQSKLTSAGFIFETLTKLANDFIIITDETGCCHLINDYARDRLGIKPSEKNPAVLQPLLQELKRLHEGYGSIREATLVEYPYKIKLDKTEISCIWSVSFLRDAASAKTQIIAVGKDITELAKLQEQIDHYKSGVDGTAEQKTAELHQCCTLLNNLLWILVSVSEKGTPGLLFDRCCQLLQKTGWDFVAMIIPADDPALYRLYAVAGPKSVLPARQSAPPTISVRKFNQTLIDQFKVEKSFFISLTESHAIAEFYQDLFQPKQPGKKSANSVLIVPMKQARAEWGYLLAFTSSTRCPETIVVNVIETIVSSVALFAQRLEFFQVTVTRADELEHANKLKTEFLANISHDLRTPLNSIMALSTMLYEKKPGPLNPDQEKQVGIIKQEGENLLRQINNILDLIKMDAVRTELSFTLFSIQSLINRAVNTIRPLCDEKNLKLNIQLAKKLPAQIFSDEAKISSTLVNLLANAVKYTERGGISIVVRTKERESKFSIAVTDTGPGMTRAEAVQIFEDFTRLEQKGKNSIPGTGLGMAIARRSVEILGGKIQVASKLRRGSTFEILLPLRKIGDIYLAGAEFKPKTGDNDVQVVIQVPDDAVRVDPDATRILILDSDIRTLALLKKPLEQLNYRTIFADSPVTALENIKKYKPRIVILNLLMNHGDGWRLLEKLRSSLYLRTIPIFSLALSEDRHNGMFLSKLEFLTDPGDDRQLARMLQLPVPGSSEKNVYLVSDNDQALAALSRYCCRSERKLIKVTESKTIAKLLRKDAPGLVLVDLTFSARVIFAIWDEILTKKVECPMVFWGRDLSAAKAIELKESLAQLARKRNRKIEQILPLLTGELSATVPWKSTGNRTGQKSEVQLDQEFVAPQGKAKILVVDDDSSTRYSLQYFLENQGYQVIFGKSGREGLELAKKTKPALILIDMMMPEMDGYEATRKLRKLSGLQYLPIIAMTGQAAETDKNRALKAGCNDYLTKPFNLDQLIKKIGEWLP